MFSPNVGDNMSAWIAMQTARGLIALILARVFSAAGRLPRYVIAIAAAPLRARSMATAEPIPREAPVTTATLPVRGAGIVVAIARLGFE